MKIYKKVANLGFIRGLFIILGATVIIYVRIFSFLYNRSLSLWVGVLKNKCHIRGMYCNK